ncbi:MAG: GntR family transcriptional regulator [Lachnospiraceae bacterium]|nr:GntR family transcriptional regulator [Lachnospiraceae bacterium]
MFQIDPLSRTPVYEQIVTQCEEYVLLGILSSGDKLPSVRQLSLELAINPNTIQKAYLELDRRKLVTSVPGRGVFVSTEAFEAISRDKKKNLSEIERLAGELKAAGVPLDEAMGAVRKAYEREEKR